MVMLPQRLIESVVGLFMLCAITALILLAFKVSGLTSFFPSKSYMVTASFNDIGALKVRAPVKIGGVQVGEVTRIDLDPVTFRAVVRLRIEDKVNDIPDDSTAGILTAGLLGDNYIEIAPMYNKTFLKNGSQIEFTRSAMVLEKLIGQLIYKLGNNGSSTNGNSDTSQTNTNQTNSNQ
jgi:phospholipid/cholesterol/gamma-HCH transport system substrate-binding protein